MRKKTFALSGNPLSLKDIKDLSLGASFSIAKEAKQKVKNARDVVVTLSKENIPYYGINTGFGLLANKAISKSDQKQLQLNIIRSHAAGFGEALSIEECRLMALLRLNVLLKGNTGVSLGLCKALAEMIKKGVIPCIPSKGSVGASGDLAPLAHLALPLIGEGEVYYKGKRMSAKNALKAASLKPITLLEKEGLGLINGTQAMLTVGGLALFDALSLVRIANQIAALTFEGFVGNPKALDPRIHKARGQPGQIACAAAIRKELVGSTLYKTKHRFVQDPYSLRCAPQVHGAALDFLEFAAIVVERESGAATDNPLIFDNQILSGGNFHGEPLAMAFDTASIAVAELASISERRLELLLNPHLSGLNAFLAAKPGLESGYMASQYLAANLVSENKILSHPASTDSIPGNAGIEDHVSMGMTAALKLKACVHNVKAVLAVELISAAQAIDLSKRSKELGKGTSKTYALARNSIPFLDKDRIVAQDINKAFTLIEEMILHER